MQETKGLEHTQQLAQVDISLASLWPKWHSDYKQLCTPTPHHQEKSDGIWKESTSPWSPPSPCMSEATQATHHSRSHTVLMHTPHLKASLSRPHKSTFNQIEQKQLPSDPRMLASQPQAKCLPLHTDMYSNGIWCFHVIYLSSLRNTFSYRVHSTPQQTTPPVHTNPA